MQSPSSQSPSSQNPDYQHNPPPAYQEFDSSQRNPAVQPSPPVYGQSGQWHQHHVAHQNAPRYMQGSVYPAFQTSALRLTRELQQEYQNFIDDLPMFDTNTASQAHLPEHISSYVQTASATLNHLPTSRAIRQLCLLQHTCYQQADYLESINSPVQSFAMSSYASALEPVIDGLMNEHTNTSPYHASKTSQIKSLGCWVGNQAFRLVNWVAGVCKQVPAPVRHSRAHNHSATQSSSSQAPGQRQAFTQPAVRHYPDAPEVRPELQWSHNIRQQLELYMLEPAVINKLMESVTPFYSSEEELRLIALAWINIRSSRPESRRNLDNFIHILQIGFIRHEHLRYLASVDRAQAVSTSHTWITQAGLTRG